MCCLGLAANTGRKKVAKNRHLGTIAQLRRAISSQLRHVSSIGKKLLSSNTSSTCPYNMVNLALQWLRSFREFGAPLQISTGLASWQRYTARHSSSGRQPNFAALNRGRHLYSAGRPSRWALAHILVIKTLPVCVSCRPTMHEAHQRRCVMRSINFLYLLTYLQNQTPWTTLLVWSLFSNFDTMPASGSQWPQRVSIGQIGIHRKIHIDALCIPYKSIFPISYPRQSGEPCRQTFLMRD